MYLITDRKTFKEFKSVISAITKDTADDIEPSHYPCYVYFHTTLVKVTVNFLYLHNVENMLESMGRR